MPENQERFFNLLHVVLGNEIEIRQGYKLINAHDFITKINGLPILGEYFADLIKILNSTYDFPFHSGPKYDGILINHPKLKSRVIEFDEEQHFTPHRMKSIELFNEYLPFSVEYEMFFNTDEVRKKSIRKNRLNNIVDVIMFRNLEETTVKIREYLENNNVNNRYIGDRPGFNYPGVFNVPDTAPAESAATSKLS